MKTLVKVLIGIVVVVVVLFGALAILVPIFFDPNEQKDEIAALVKKATGRELQIEGDVELSVFPWLGVQTGRVTLGNAAGFAPSEMASTEGVNVRIKLLPLLGKRVEADVIVIDGLRVNLAKDKSGKTNWDDLVAGEGAEAQDKSESGGTALAGFAIGGVDIRDAALNWDDQSTGQKVNLKGLNVKTGSLAAGEPVAFMLGFQVAVSEPQMTADVAVSSTISMDPAHSTFSAKDLVVETALQGDVIPGGKTEIRLGAQVSGDIAKQTLTVSELVVAALDLEAKGNVAVAQLTSKPVYTAKLDVATFDLKKLLAGVGAGEIKTADEAAMTKVAMSLAVKGSATSLSADTLAVTLDDSKLTGKLAVQDFAKQSLRFDLVLDRIDVDRYLPPATEDEAMAKGTPATAAAGQSQLFPKQQLRALDVIGKVKVGALKAAKLNVTDIVVDVSARGGVIDIKVPGAKLYDGSYVGSTKLDVRGKTAKISVSETLSGVQAGPLLADLQGVDRLSGAANVKGQVSAVGDDVDALKKTMNGKIRFDFTDGAIKGINVAKMLRDAQAKLSGGGASSSDEPNQTDFSALGGTIDIKNGLATNSDLAAKSPFLRVGGKGNANLVSEAIDYTARVTVVASTAGQGGKELADLSGLDIPIRVTGTFSEPSYGLDMQALAGSIAKSKVGDVVEKQKAAVTEKAQKAVGEKLGGDALKGIGGDKAGGALKKLFGN